MKIAIVKSNGIVDKRIERVLVSNKIKGDFVDKVTRNIVINYDYVVFSQHNSLPNLPKVIERVVLEKKAIVLLVNRTLNIGHFYNVMNDNRFHIINEQSLEQELILTINIASKYNGLIQNLSNDNLKLKSRVNLLENTNKAKRILISKGLSEAESHNIIQKKAMDMRISKNEMVSLIIENKIDI